MGVGANAFLNAFAAADRLLHARAQGDRRGARRAAEALLHPGRDGVQPPGVGLQRVAAERRGGVGVKQHVVAAADSAKLREWLQHGGGGVALYGEQQARTNTLNRILHLVRGEHLAPRHLDGMYLRPTAAGNFAQQVTKAAKDRNQHFIPRANGGNQYRFNPRPGGTVDQHRPAIFSAEYAAIERHHLVHVVGHGRIVLADQLARHGAQHARVGVDRARSHQQALGRIDLRKACDIHC